MLFRFYFLHIVYEPLFVCFSLFPVGNGVVSFSFTYLLVVFICLFASFVFIFLKGYLWSNPRVKIHSFFLNNNKKIRFFHILCNIIRIYSQDLYLHKKRSQFRNITVNHQKALKLVLTCSPVILGINTGKLSQVPQS